MLSLSKRVAIWVFAFVALCTQAALAQPSPTEPSAQQLVDRGLASVSAGRWEEARESFAQAYALSPQALILLNLAGAQANTQRLRAAVASYSTFLHDANPSERARYGDAAERVLRDLESRVPRARFVLANARPGDSLSLDGQTVSSPAEFSPLDPGPHVLVVTRDGVEVARSPFTLSEAETRALTITLPIPRVAAPIGNTHREHAIAIRDRAHSTSARPSPWPWIGAGAGVVVAAGIVVALVYALAPQPYVGTFGNGLAVAR
jgi:hypothetical protein